MDERTNAAYTNVREIGIKRRISYTVLDIPDYFPYDLAEFRDERVIVGDGYETPVSDNGVETGIATIEAIEHATGLDRINCSFNAPGMYKDMARAVLLPSDMLREITEKGAEPHEIISKHEQKTDISSKMQSSAYRLVLWNSASGNLMDTSFKFLPVRIHIDYVMGGVDNSRYNLKALLAYLKAYPSVLNSDDLKIRPIPGYNQHGKITDTISFDVLFPDAIYDAIMRKLLSDCKESYGIQYFTLSYIGANEFRKDNAMCAHDCGAGCSKHCSNRGPLPTPVSSPKYGHEE